MIQKVTERYFFFSVSNGASKMNLYLNLPVHSLLCIWKYTCHVLTWGLENDDEKHFN